MKSKFLKKLTAFALTAALAATMLPRFGGVVQKAEAAAKSSYTPYIDLSIATISSLGWDSHSAEKSNTEEISHNGTYTVSMNKASTGATMGEKASNIYLLELVFPGMAADLGCTFSSTASSATGNFALRKAAAINAGVSFTDVTLTINNNSNYTFSFTDDQVMFGDLNGDGNMVIVLQTDDNEMTNYYGYNQPSAITSYFNTSSRVIDIKVTFTINVSTWKSGNEKSLQDGKGSITLSQNSYVYDGTEKKPDVTVTYDGSVLTKDVDYTVAYENNVDHGTATATVTGKGNYEDTLSANYEIQRASLTNATFGLSAIQYTYDGTEKTPAVTNVYDSNNRALYGGYDYEVIYLNNVDAGTASVYLNGLGNYTGTTGVLNFSITRQNVEAANVSAVLGTTQYYYDGTAKTPGLTVSAGGTVLTKDVDYTVSYSDNTEVGTAHATITFIKNYTGTLEREFYIAMPEDTLYGDINQDGEIGNKDIILMRRYLADPDAGILSTLQILLADLNSDGVVNNKDLYIMRRHVADPQSYPIPANN